MKKLITLLALCCLMVTGAWADVQKLHLAFSNFTSTSATVSVTDQSGTAVAGVSASVSQAVQNGTTNKNYFTSGDGCNAGVLGVNYDNSTNNYWEITFTITGLSSFNGREIPSIDVCTPLLTSGNGFQGGAAPRTWERTLTVDNTQYGETLTGTIVNDNGEVWNHFENASATISGGQLVLKVKMKKTDALGCFAGVKYIDINMPTTPTTQTYTVNITGATGATVTFGSNTYANGQTFSAENPTASQFTASEVPGFYPSISIGTNTINVTYNLLPFTTGRTYNLTLKGNIVYYDEATGNFKAGNVEDSENTCFIIGGTYADGYTLKSVGADAYLKHNNINNDKVNATTTATESDATRYEYATTGGNHFFKLKGSSNTYVNYRDGYFSTWNSGGLGDNGSKLTFSEPVDPVKGYHIFQNNGTLNTTGSSGYCSQWTSSHINPQISINVTDGNGAANDMEKNSTYANNGIVCYTGNDRDKQGYKATLTVAASYGYKITGFQFDASKADNSDYTIDVTAGGTTKTVSGTTAQHFSQTGVNAQEFVIVIKETAGSATHNKPILLNNFYVTYEAAEPLESEYKLVFDNAHSSVPYRIPAVGQTKDGDLIFVADYRYSGQDIGMVHNGKLDLKMRKKYANGEWGEEETLQACIDNGSEFMAFGDPCIVCDRESNSVMVTSCCGNVSFPNGTYENHQGWARWYSSDGGNTWESSFNTLAPQVVKQLDERQGDQMQAFFIGSGKISQSHIIKKGQYYRLYCASNTRMQSGKCNFVWYSDDFGVTWNLLGSPDVKAINGGDEPKADELPDGSVVISSRDTGRIFNIFHYTDYENAEGYWGSQATSSSNNSGCYGTGCNGEILIVPVMKKSDNSKTYLALQSIPAASDRRNVSIYWKELTDFTKYRNASELAPDWTKFQVSGTTSAYSTMCQMKDGDIAFFYEENSYNNGYDMVYKKFSVEAITDDLYEFYDLNATEKAAYLTSCVGTYFDEETKEIQTLAEAYEADPTMKKYDALNAGIIAALNKTYKKGVAVTQQSDLQNGDLVIIDVKAKNATTDAVLYYVGENTSMSNRGNFRAHIYNVTEYPANHVWEVVDVNTSTTPNTFKLRSVINNTIYLPSGNTTSATNTAATFYFKESTGYNDGVNRFALAFSNNENADHYTYHFNAKPATGQGEPICFWGYGAASTDSQGAFAFYKVAEDIPTPALSIETNTTVTSSQLSELSITFTGANAAQVQLSETKNKAYLTPKASTPAQVKAQNGKLKAAGETPAAIEGTITKDSNTDGKFNIAFEDEIPAGDYELSIPEGTFLVGTTPVPELTANYTVEESAPTLPPYADLPLTSGVYEIQNSPTMSGGNRGYLVDYTSYTNGPSLAECHYSGCENNHPNAKNDGSTTSSKWYVYNDNGTYYIVSLSTLGGKNTPQFLNPASPSTYSTEKVALTIAQHSSNTVQGSDGNTYHSNLISKSTSVYLSAACGTASTSGAVKTDTNGNDGGVPWVFIPCDESTLTTEQVALRDKAIEIINYEIPTAGKVYTIKAHFTDKTDLYLTSNTEAENLLLPMPTEATANQSYWVAEDSGNNSQPWKFKSGYGYAMSLTKSNPGLTTGGTAFSVSANSDGTYCLVDGSNLYIGTWGANDDGHKGFGSYGAGGNCWKTGGRNSASWTTDYEIVEVTGVKAYLVSCDNTNGGVAPKFSDYAGVATVKNGGYIIVPNGTTLNATNFPAAEISGYTGSVTFNGTTITVTYEATTTPDGFHIYENNGTYSNVSSSSASFRDKWTSTQDAPRFEIFAHENGNSNGSNNMKPDATYANSGIVCYSGNKTNNISGMTVSIPTNGYVITGYSFKVKNYDTGDYSITVSAGESSVNTSSENKTISVSGLSVSSFEIIIDGSNGSLNKGVVLTDFYVTYAEGEHDVEVPATGYYYIKDNGQYLYNDFLNHPEATQSIATKQTYDNGYVWKVTSTEGSTTVTLLNGEGSGYKANAGAEEETSIDLTGKNWTFEACGHKIITCNVLYDVMGDYATFDKGYVINADLNSVAHDGGFFVVDENEMLHATDFKAFEQDVTQGTIMGTTAPDGTKWAGVRMYDGLHVKNISAYYYTEQDVERYLDVVKKTYEVFYKHEGEPGYCTELDWDFENNPDLAVLMEIVQGFFFYDEDEIPLEEYVQDMIEPYEAKYYLGKLCNYIKGLEIAPPVQGEAYRIAVRGNDYTGNTKYYLKNDGTYTANEAEADVFVLGGSGDETCGSLLVTNNNPGTEGGIHYLQVRADGVAMNTEYKEADNALNLVSMTKAEGENIQSCPAYLYGTFSATNKDGKVLTFDETGDGSWISDAESLYMKDNKTSAIELIPVEYPYNKPKFAVGSPDDHDGGYASIWLPYPMVFPEGVEAYRATSVENDGILILTKVNEDTNTVAAGGYILYTPGQGEDTDPDNLPLVLPAPADPEDVTPYADNAFVGSTENPLVVKEEGSWATFKAKYEGTAYVLARKNNVIGYYKYRETETCLPKGKAIWFSNYKADSSAECLRFTFEEVISAIEALHGNTDNAEIYDLQGHRLNKVEKGQVNVINGKKVMFK